MGIPNFLWRHEYVFLEGEALISRFSSDFFYFRFSIFKEMKNKERTK